MTHRAYINILHIKLTIKRKCYYFNESLVIKTIFAEFFRVLFIASVSRIADPSRVLFAYGNMALSGH